MRVTRWLDELTSDVRFALRTLNRSPTFSIGAVLTLALTVGVNGAVFALADATILRPVPFPHPEQLVMLHEQTPASARGTVAPFEFDLWSQRNRTFESMAAIALGNRAVRGMDGNAEQIPAQTVGTRLFDVLGVKPILGRTFLPADDRLNADAVVLAEPFWRSRFGADPAVVGRQLEMDGQRYTIVGVVPASAQVQTRSSVWTVLTTTTMRSPIGVAHYLRVIGRLRSDQTIQTASADMDTVAKTIARERPELNKDRGVALEPLGDALVGRDLRLTSLLLAGLVALVLLTGCANIANLLLARASVRTPEFTMRGALGAGRRRLIRQMLTESLVLSAVGGIFGVVVAAAILRAAPSLLPAEVLPVTVSLASDARVVAFCAGVTVVVAMMFGIAPAWHAAGASLSHGMGGGRVTSGLGARFRGLIVATELAVAMFLLCGAGLLGRSLLALERVETGSGADEALTMAVNLPFVPPGGDVRYATPAARWRFFESVEREVGRVSSVRSVAWGSVMPLDGWQMSMGFDIAGKPPRPEALKDDARYHAVSAAYFQTLGIPVLGGRAFDERDGPQGKPTCIVNEAFVRRFLPSGDAVGKRLVIRGLTTGGGPLPVREIVGVVRQVREQPDEIEAQPHIYIPLAQDPGWAATLVVRPRAGRAESLTADVRAAIARVDRDRPVTKVRSLAGIGREATARPRLRAVVVGAFAALGLGLGALGVFAVIAYSIEQRMQEFGVRMAFGATSSDVVRNVLAGATRVTFVGIATGVVGVFLVSRWIGSFLFGIQALDPTTFAAAGAVLAMTSIVATLTPAWRAAKADPVSLLRGR